MDDKDLITYCGAYCGTCARYTGYTAFREAASLLGELTEVHGYQHWMPEVVKEFDYAEFRKGLEFFSDPESWLVCQRGCCGGDGRPDCPMRDCCREHRLDVCFDCEEFPCEKVEWNKRTLNRADEYRKLGKEKWLQLMVEKANQGFELHTEKYYQVEIIDNPPNPL